MTCGVEAFCIITLLKNFFTPRDNRPLVYAACAACFLAYYWVPTQTILSESIFSKLLVSIVIWALCGLLAFKGSAFQKLFVVLCFFVVLCALDLTVFQVIAFITHAPSALLLTNLGYYLLGVFTARTLLILLCVCICKFQRAVSFASIAYSTWVMVLLFPVFSILTFSTIIEKAILQNNVSIGIVLEGIGLIAFNVALLVLLEKLELADTMKKTNLAMEQQISHNLKEIEALQAIYKEQRSLTHDFNQHIYTIYELLSAEKCEAARLYTKSVLDTPSTGTMVVSTNNQVLDALLNQKYTMAKKQNTAVQFTVNDLSSLPISEKDAVVLIGNLFDNALEACARVKTATSMQIKMLKKNDHLLLTVGNTSLPVHIEQNNIITNKQDAQRHGFGLKNIQRILQTYGCEYSISYADNWFQFTTIL